MRRILKKIQVPLPHETGFNAAGNPYTESEILKICEDYRVPNDPMRYRDEKFYWTYQRGVGWPDDYIGPDSMTRWIIAKSVGFTDVGLLRISESVRAYAYLILRFPVNLVVPAIISHKTNSLETPAIKNHKTNSLEPTTSQGLTHTPAISQKNQEPKTIIHNEEKIALVLALAGGFAIWNIFR